MVERAYSPSEPPACAREDGVEVIFYDGPLPSLGSEPLTKAEESFREALGGAGERTSRYGRWALKARADWHQRTGTPVRGGE